MYSHKEQMEFLQLQKEIEAKKSKECVYCDSVNINLYLKYINVLLTEKEMQIQVPIMALTKHLLKSR